jgi:hypothetical protein
MSLPTPVKKEMLKKYKETQQKKIPGKIHLEGRKVNLNKAKIIIPRLKLTISKQGQQMWKVKRQKQGRR